VCHAGRRHRRPPLHGYRPPRTRCLLRTADALVREIAALADERTGRELAERLISEFNVHGNLDLRALELWLTGMRDALRREARSRGFEA
jgi:hypothetical protein